MLYPLWQCHVFPWFCHPSLVDQIRNGNPITLTEPKMTRFIMSLEEAVDLVLFAFEHGQNGDILVQKAPACTIQIQAEAVCELFGGKKEDIKVIGIRHGEKMYETLLTKENVPKQKIWVTSTVSRRQPRFELRQVF